jgi:hypothetical protein
MAEAISILLRKPRGVKGWRWLRLCLERWLAMTRVAMPHAVAIARERSASTEIASGSSGSFPRNDRGNSSHGAVKGMARKPAKYTHLSSFFKNIKKNLAFSIFAA